MGVNIVSELFFLFHWITIVLHVAQVYSLFQLGALLHAMQKCMLNCNRKNKVLAPAPFMFLHILINVLILLFFASLYMNVYTCLLIYFSVNKPLCRIEVKESYNAIDPYVDCPLQWSILVLFVYSPIFEWLAYMDK